MIHKKIKLRAYGKIIELCFNSRITLLGGDSGIGKTLLYSILNNITALDEFSNIYCINSEDINRHKIKLISMLKTKENTLIVIDNAEEILGKNERQFICRNFVNQYLILGRNRDYLGIGDDSIGELKVTKSQMYIEYPELKKVNDIQNSPYKFTIKLP